MTKPTIPPKSSPKSSQNSPPKQAAQPTVGDMSASEVSHLIDQAKVQASKVFKKIPLLGPVTWLMMQQAATKHTLISELEWRVMPALIQEQAKLYMREESPLAYVSWARMSAASAERYRRAPHHLMFSDWRCGDQVWLIDIVTPFGGAQDVMQDLREKVFPGQEIHQLMPTPDEPLKMLTWPAVGVGVTRH